MGVKELPWQILFSKQDMGEKPALQGGTCSVREAQELETRSAITSASETHLVSLPVRTEVGRERKGSQGFPSPSEPQLHIQDQLRQRSPTHLLAVRARKVVRCCLQMVLQGFRGGVLIYTLHTSECREKGQSL